MIVQEEEVDYPVYIPSWCEVGRACKRYFGEGNAVLVVAMADDTYSSLLEEYTEILH